MKPVILKYFATEYKAGRHANPCVMCNSRIGQFGRD